MTITGTVSLKYKSSPVWSVSTMSPHVSCYWTWLGKFPIANCAAERFFPAVSPAVGCQVCRLTEWLVAQMTSKCWHQKIFGEMKPDIFLTCRVSRHYGFSGGSSRSRAVRNPCHKFCRHSSRQMRSPGKTGRRMEKLPLPPPYRDRRSWTKASGIFFNDKF